MKGTMKKLLCLLLVLTVLGTMAQIPVFAEETDGSTETSSEATETSGEVTESSESSEPSESSSEASSESSEEPSSSSSETTTEPTETTTAPTVPAPVITKHPTSESVQEGDTAKFVARADNAESVQWYIRDFLASAGPDHFAGLRVSGANTNTLTLSNIPLSMEGIAIHAVFTNGESSVSTNSAYLTVNKKKLASPGININPHGGEGEIGAEFKLSVIASSIVANAELHYQWYSNTRAVAFGGQAIPGATEYIYVPDCKEPGDYYYYAEVWCTADSQTSGKSVSSCAKIVITEPPTTEATTQAAEDTRETISFTTEPTQPVQKKSGKSVILTVLIILLILSVAATVGLIVFMRWQDMEEENVEPIQKPATPKGVWFCECGAMNEGNATCRECGNPRYQPEPDFQCPTCGWKPRRLSQKPDQCPICGADFLNLEEIDLDSLLNTDADTEDFLKELNLTEYTNDQPTSEESWDL